MDDMPTRFDPRTFRNGEKGRPVTNPKESSAHSRVMNATSRRAVADRDRAIARLRTLTLGTTIASIAAVGAFGAVAAVSYSGTASDVTTAAATNGNSSTATPTTSGSTGLQATPVPTTTTAGSGHATSGGS
jgi:hypothetical protein